MPYTYNSSASVISSGRVSENVLATNTAPVLYVQTVNLSPSPPSLACVKLEQQWLPLFLGLVLAVAVVGWCTVNVLKASRRQAAEDAAEESANKARSKVCLPTHTYRPAYEKVKFRPKLSLFCEAKDHRLLLCWINHSVQSSRSPRCVFYVLQQSHKSGPILLTCLR